MTFNTGSNESQKSLCSDKNNMIQYSVGHLALGSKAALHIQNIEKSQKYT